MSVQKRIGAALAPLFLMVSSHGAAEPVKIGKPAPEFQLLDQHGVSHSLAGYRGRWLVIYFYPKDDTSSCTMQANDFTALKDEFEKAGARVFGISKDSKESHIDFIDKYGLTVDLLSDVNGTVCELYGAWGEKEKDGVKKMGIIRSTFVIDKTGLLRYVEYNVSAPRHAEMMLEFVKGMSGS